MYIDDFLNYLEYEKRYSSHTITAYRTDLYEFERFLNEESDIKDIEEASAKNIRAWLISLIKNKIAPRSANRKLVALRSFYKYCIRNKRLEINPMDRVVPLKVEKRLPMFVAESGMNELLDTVMPDGDDFETVRDKLIIDLFYLTGIRLSELINIKITDIDRGSQTLRVFGKRSKERIVPLYRELVESIDRYMEVRKTLEVRNEYLFLTSKGVQLYPVLVYRIVHKNLAYVTTISQKSPHILRHSFATHMLNAGAELNDIKEFLGHAGLAATQVYTHNTFEKLKAVYKQAHPRT